jgi:hypothetical protein
MVHDFTFSDGAWIIFGDECIITCKLNAADVRRNGIISDAMQRCTTRCQIHVLYIQYDKSYYYTIVSAVY